MDSLNINIIKGIHPGIILGRELKKRKLAKGRFAISINEYPQILGDIINQKRRMNIPLALKIEHDFGFEEGYFMMLQVYYDIKQEKKKKPKITPDLTRLRSVLFWDTNMETIDWKNKARAVIERVFERGNEVEKEEITRFYGTDTINFYLAKNG